MRHARRLSLGAIGVAVLTLSMILSGCGTSDPTATGTVAPDGATSTATAAALASEAAAAATSAAAATPFPAATTDPAMVEFAGCDPLQLKSTQPGYSAVAGLKVSIPQRYSPLDFPSQQLPSNAPNAPYQLSAGAVSNFNPNPPVNPSLSTGYVIQVCNQTSASHTLSSLNVTIAGFTPSSGPVAVWHLCQDGPYDAATKQTTGGCGGATGGVDWLAATLPNDATGASARATANTQVHSSGPDLPIALPPNKSIELLVAVNGLTSQGTYALSFGLSVDGAAPTTLTPGDGSFFIAPAATIWTGTACQTAAMQAHIPAASQDTYYVCPPAS